MGQLPHLARVQRAVRDGHAQHVGVQLQVKPVHQAQRAEFVLGQRAVEAALHLIGELRHAGAHEGFVEVGIGIHCAWQIGLLAVGVVRGAAGAECLAEMGGLGAVRAGLGIGQIGADDKPASAQRRAAGASGHGPRPRSARPRGGGGPAVIGGQIDHIAFAQARWR